jgi:hypothetical protein
MANEKQPKIILLQYAGSPFVERAEAALAYRTSSLPCLPRLNPSQLAYPTRCSTCRVSVWAPVPCSQNTASPTDAYRRR